MSWFMMTVRRVRALLLLGCVALLVGALPLAAQSATLLSDDFEDGNASGWSASGGSWAVASDGSQVYRQSSTSADARSLAGSTGWTDYTVSARVKPISFNGSDRFVAVIARAQSGTSYYYLALRSSGRVELKRLASGSSTTLATASVSVAAGQWYTLSLSVAGSSLSGSVNGAALVSASDTRFTAGRAGLATFYTSAAFDDVLVSGAGATTPTPVTPTTTTRTPTPITPTAVTRTPTPVTVTPTPVTPTATAVTATPTPVRPLPGGPIGFASLNALGQNGTTGGAGGTVVTVDTAAELIDYIARPGPYVIQVQGTISLSAGPALGMYDVSSDKTIVGIGATARIVGGGFNIGLPISDAITAPPANAVHNVIIRNIAFSGALDDSINIQMFSHHVWVDHNEFTDGNDGLVDVKRGSDYVTISWNYFHDHDKVSLVGHSDNNAAQDTGRLHVTYHHNFFHNTITRHPRVRFAEPVHVFNNYYLNIQDYGIAGAKDAGILVEGNYFENASEPTNPSQFGESRIVERNNIYVRSDAPETGGSVVEPSTFYSYTLDNPANIPAIVQSGAGVGRLN